MAPHLRLLVEEVRPQVEAALQLEGLGRVMTLSRFAEQWPEVLVCSAVAAQTDIQSHGGWRASTPAQQRRASFDDAARALAAQFGVDFFTGSPDEIVSTFTKCFFECDFGRLSLDKAIHV